MGLFKVVVLTVLCGIATADLWDYNIAKKACLQSIPGDGHSLFLEMNYCDLVTELMTCLKTAAQTTKVENIEEVKAIWSTFENLCQAESDSNKLGATEEFEDGGDSFVEQRSNSQFEDASLGKHNEYRRRHGVPELVLDRNLCNYAKEWANRLAAMDKFEHRPNSPYGENLFMKWGSDPNLSARGGEATESWYKEIKDYKFGQEPRNMMETGHFTQVVWKSSKRLGVAWSKSRSGKVIVVANYDPPGNYGGRYRENVPPPK